METIAYFLLNGHTLQEMLSLSPVEMLFYRQVMAVDVERKIEMLGGEQLGR